MPKLFPQGAAQDIAKKIADRAPGKMSWNQVADLAETICGSRPSRHWLATNKLIVGAFHERANVANRIGVAVAEPRTQRQRDRRRIEQLEQEIITRDRLLAQYDERLALYLKRARDKGLTQHYLEEPLKPVVRGASRRSTKHAGRRG